MLEELLVQETGLNPTEIMTDTASPALLFLAFSGCRDTSFPRARLMPKFRFSGA
ncbi:hypothetical protein DO659_25955 [Salmonella enterica subsp. enterica serovar Minnesota]|nr:hypothetical protein [Salmonella enterica subsp. enterica serovar Minnesota]ECI4647654.1 hypothetical protein [Salmonella enterica subsp. salamae]